MSETLFSFQTSAHDGWARRGVLNTAHGSIQTPVFMPVGTAATVKAVSVDQVKDTGAEIILANTYHLMLRPGEQTVARLGGLHRFMNWTGPILTDSGGYQVWSLAKLRTIDEEGVVFQSHLDGARCKLTPESAVAIQQALDADITMVLDECTEYPATVEKAQASMARSMRWAARGKEAFVARPGYGLFGIVQGGMHGALRAESARRLRETGFDGYAIGGLSVGEPQAEMFSMLEATTPHLPEDSPRYLMGVGRPGDIIGAVMRGVDMFDCVLPTRSGRTGKAFTHFGEINIRNARHGEDPRPLDPECACPVCAHYSRGYLNHLIRCDEILGCTLMTWHNIFFYQDLMRDIRQAIEKGRMTEFAKSFSEDQARGDIEPIG